MYKDRAETFGLMDLGFASWALIALFVFGRHCFTPIFLLGGSLLVSGIGFALAKYTKPAIAAFLGVIVAVYQLMIK